MAYKKVRELEDKIVENPKGHEIIVMYPGINLLFNLLDGKIKEHWSGQMWKQEMVSLFIKRDVKR